MSEIVLQPWMRASETAEPVPTDAEKELAAAALRGCIENTHEEARNLDEGDMVHLHVGRRCMETVTLEVEDGTVILSTASTEDGVAYTATLIQYGAQHDYVCYDGSKVALRTDSSATVNDTIDVHTTGALTLDDELAMLLSDGDEGSSGDASLPVSRPAITVGRREIGALVGVIADATFLPQQSTE